MTLQEWKNDGSGWVMVGQFNDVKEDEVDALVEKWLVENTKLVLLDEEGDYLKEWVK